MMMKKLCLILFFGLILLNGKIITQVEAATDAPDCKQGEFNADCLFPTWQSEENPTQSEDAVVQGVIGTNHDGGFIMTYIPTIIDILLKFVAPIVTIMLIWTGVLFVISQGDDDGLR
nr:hypothetical protein [uncultured Hyphomonas sp.]